VRGDIVSLKTVFSQKIASSFIEKIFVYVDGAAGSNPGPAGVGVVIYDTNGNQRDEYKEFLEGGDKTCNEAEYYALIKGLERACSHCLKNVVCFSDSQLVIKQMNREWRIHCPRLRELHLQVRQLELMFESVKYVSCSKENDKLKLADRLSKQAIDQFLNN
jgi:ribonuclease HI